VQETWRYSDDFETELRAAVAARTRIDVARFVDAADVLEFRFV
jgi:hypothetical protein